MMASSPKGGSRILSGALWQVVAQVAPLFVNLALTPFVITSLGARIYGLWIVTVTFVNFVGQVDGGINATVLRYFASFASQERDEGRRNSGRYLRSVSLVILAIYVVLVIPITLAADRIAEFFHTPADQQGDMVFLIQCSLLLLMAALLRNALAGVLNGHQRYALTSISQLLAYIAYASTVLVSLIGGWGLAGMAWASIVQGLLSIAIITPAALRLVKLRGVGWMSKAEIREFASLAWKVQISGILSIMSFQATTLIVGRAAAAQVAAFGPGSTFAQQLRNLPMNAARPIQSALGQTFNREGRSALEAQFISLQTIWVQFIVGWIVVGAPAAMNAVIIWLPLPGTLHGVVAAILLFSHMFTLITVVLRQFLLTLGIPEVDMTSASVSVGLILVLSLIAVGPFGVIGVTVASVIAQVLGMVVYLVFARYKKALPRSPLRDIPVLPAVVCGAVSFAVTGLARHGLSSIGFEGGVALLLVAATAALPFGLYMVWVIGPQRTLRIIKSRRLT